MAQLVTKAEYARRRGISGAAVTQAVKAGRLSLVDGMVDLDTADAEWGSKSRPRVNSEPAVKKTRPRHEPDDVDLVVPPWQDSKAKQAAIDARKAELELAVMEGKLIDRAKYRADMGRQFAAIRQGLLNIAARMAPTLAGMKSTAEIETALDTELRAVLSQYVGEATA